QEIAVAHPAILDPQVASVQPPQLPQSAFERGDTRLRFRVVGGHRHQRDDASPAAALLRTRRERPRRGGAPEQREDLAPFHSTHSTAATSSLSGTVRPSIRAVGWLITNSNLLDCTTGRSAGFAPLRMRPV